MLRFFTALALALSGCVVLLAQNIGDSAQAVEAALGRPQMSRTTSTGEIWIYAEGARVTFKNGVVSALEGVAPAAPGSSPASAAPAASTSTTMTVVPEAKPAQPAPRVERDARANDESSDTGGSGAGRASTIPRWKLGGLTFALVVAGIVSIICQILILIRAFTTSIWWGLGSLFVPFVSLFFILFNWSEVKTPFLVNLGAVGAVALMVFAM